MKISDRLQAVTRLFLDSAPVIYAVEKHPRYVDLVRVALKRLDAGALSAGNRVDLGVNCGKICSGSNDG